MLNELFAITPWIEPSARRGDEVLDHDGGLQNRMPALQLRSEAQVNIIQEDRQVLIHATQFEPFHSRHHVKGPGDGGNISNAGEISPVAGSVDTVSNVLRVRSEGDAAVLYLIVLIDDFGSNHSDVIEERYPEQKFQPVAGFNEGVIVEH